MPKSEPPGLVTALTLEPFEFDAHARREIAKALGRPALGSPLDTYLEGLVFAYRASVPANQGATVGASIAALDTLAKKQRDFDKALRLFMDPRSGVDSETFDALKPSAVACGAALEHLSRAVELQRERLAGHPRVEAASESLRYFCGMLCLFFTRFAAADVASDAARLREFALTVFEAADIPSDDYRIHPRRLDELLATPILPEDRPSWPDVTN